jgi:membrane associated rhomboid family serine protease
MDSLSISTGSTSIMAVNAAMGLLTSAGWLSEGRFEATRSSVFSQKEYHRLLLALVQHADLPHMLYNCLHLAMFLPALEARLPGTAPKRAAALWLLYGATGGAGMLTFLVGIRRKFYTTFGDAVDFIPLLLCVLSLSRILLGLSASMG